MGCQRSKSPVVDLRSHCVTLLLAEYYCVVAWGPFHFLPLQDGRQATAQNHAHRLGDILVKHVNTNSIHWLPVLSHKVAPSDHIAPFIRRTELTDATVRFRRGRKFVVLIVGGRAAS